MSIKADTKELESLVQAKLPDKINGFDFSPFLTWSDSPVNDDSSILRSLDCIRMPSAGRRSPYFI